MLGAYFGLRVWSRLQASAKCRRDFLDALLRLRLELFIHRDSSDRDTASRRLSQSRCQICKPRDFNDLVVKSCILQEPACCGAPTAPSGSRAKFPICSQFVSLWEHDNVRESGQSGAGRNGAPDGSPACCMRNLNSMNSGRCACPINRATPLTKGVVRRTGGFAEPAPGPRKVGVYPGLLCAEASRLAS
jgi:hypothetical protein